jgi:hypothetical protein
MIKAKILLICVFGILALTATATFADTISQTATWADTVLNWSSAKTFNQFDPSLGTLNWVQLTFVGNTWGSVSVENRSELPQTASSYLKSRTRLTDSGGSQIFNLYPTKTFSNNLEEFDGDYDYAGTDSATNTVLKASAGAASGTVTYNAGLAAWTGTGTVSYTGAASNFSGTSTPDINFTSSATGNASLTVTYDYTLKVSDHEPSSIIIAGFGLIGIALFGRRFQKHLIS